MDVAARVRYSGADEYVVLHDKQHLHQAIRQQLRGCKTSYYYQFGVGEVANVQGSFSSKKASVSYINFYAPFTSACSRYFRRLYPTFSAFKSQHGDDIQHLRSQAELALSDIRDADPVLRYICKANHYYYMTC